MDEERKKPETDTREIRGRQWRLKDGTVVSRPQDWKPRTRNKWFTITDPARFGCSMLVFLVTAIMILLHCAAE